MRNFALNEKGIPTRMQKVLDASRSNALPSQEQLQYFKAMISESEKQDIATAYFQDGKEEGKVEVARTMLAKKKYSVEEIADCANLPIELVKNMLANLMC